MCDVTIRKPVRARACSSIANLGHGLDVFGLAVDIGHDVVEIASAAKGVVVETRGSPCELPSDPRRNTAGLAVLSLMERYGLTDPIRIIVTKRTRPGSGLGSSAASAAAAVMAANTFFGLDLRQHALIEFAAEGERAAAGAAHPDNVAPALLGGLTICTLDRPPRVLHVEPPAGMRLAVALPAVELRTETARKALPKELSLRQYSQGCAQASIAILSLARGDAEAFGWSIEESFIEACRAPLIPGYDAVRAAAKAAGALGVTICGAGPAMLAVVGPAQDAAAIGAAMREGFNSVGVASDIFIARPAGGAAIL